jgi:hypothetical protein
MAELGYYSGRYKPDYQSWTNGVIEKLFHAKELDQFIVYCGKKEYGRLAMQIISILGTEYAAEERFAVLSGALVSLVTSVGEMDWKRSTCQDNNDPAYDRYHQKESLADTREVNFFLDQMKKETDTDERFKTYTAFCFTLGRLSGTFYRSMTTVDVVRAVELGLIKIDILYRSMFILGEIRRYGGKNPGDQAQKDLETYPCLGKAAREAADRVIDIELRRGDNATEVSDLALALTITRHEGAEIFARFLVALGKETFVRGYIYTEGDPDKKTALSSLLRASCPGPEDSAETLRAALAGKIADRRLIEAAMYAPAWIGIVGDYLGWPDLESAAWYFHAHINENFSAEKETEVVRYSPITPEEFNDGAFDIAWFKEAYAGLGKNVLPWFTTAPNI